MTHNYTGYTNHGCRCEICRESNRVHCAALWAKMKAFRPTCQHYKWRSNGAKYEVCSRCGASRRKPLAVAA